MGSTRRTTGEGRILAPRADREREREGDRRGPVIAYAIAEAVASRDVGSLARLAMAPQVQLFAARSAIQVLGCDEMTVVGHVPVDQALLAAVDVAAAQLVVAPQ